MNGASAFVNDTAAQLALRRWRSILGTGLFRAIVVAAAAITTASSVSFDDGWRQALIALTINGVESWLTAATATLGILLIEPPLRFVVLVVVRYAVTGIVVSPAVFGVVVLVEVLLRRAEPTPAFIGRVATTVLISVAAISAVAGLLRRREIGPSTGDMTATVATTSSPALDIGPPKLAAFLRRLPTRLGHELIRVSVYDHYVEAHTPRGHELILIRFADALAELDGYDGLQVHRSHWVARAAVRRLLRGDGRSLVVELTDGTRLPVSRSREAATRAAGFPLEKD